MINDFNTPTYENKFVYFIPIIYRFAPSICFALYRFNASYIHTHKTTFFLKTRGSIRDAQNVPIQIQVEADAQIACKGQVPLHRSVDPDGVVGKAREGIAC